MHEYLGGAKGRRGAEQITHYTFRLRNEKKKKRKRKEKKKRLFVEHRNVIFVFVGINQRKKSRCVRLGRLEERDRHEDQVLEAAEFGESSAQLIHLQIPEKRKVKNEK